MEIRATLTTLVVAVVLAVTIWPHSVVCGFENLPNIQDATISKITRQHNGDLFVVQNSICDQDVCVGLSSGTASTAGNDTFQPGKGLCPCQCHSHLPAFREDLRICVDDIHECILAPFVSGSTTQQIPFVFLPLKGQIIHPSKEISFAGIQTPVCAVSGAKFLTEAGWIDLRNPIDTDVPFRLFRDEGRTFLQWVGEPELRLRMSGRLVLVHLMCRELSTEAPLPPERLPLFAPCVAFRVVGSPTKYIHNMNEVLFSADTHVESHSSGLSISEYVAIGICSVLLGFIYVSSVLLYLHIRKRRKERKRPTNFDDKTLTTMEEGVVKNNPLLGLGRHFPNQEFSYSTGSDNEAQKDTSKDDKHRQTTSVVVHPQYRMERQPFVQESAASDTSSIEKLPEENVSIVETLEGREDRPDTVKAITGTTRRKLYFNPAYFEPHLLQAPPPAAIEFLTKIREVITIAKQKMSSKKFTPSLVGIPEEDASSQTQEQPRRAGSRRGSMISLKRENSRRKTCSGCPGCEPQDFKNLCGKLPEFPALAACESCSTNTESKQRSIQKWLEDIPMLKPTAEVQPKVCKKEQRRLRSPARSLSPDQISAPIMRALSPRPASESGKSHEVYENKALSVCSKTPSDSCIASKRRRSNIPRKVICKPKGPPPPIPSPKSDRMSDKSSVSSRSRPPPPPPPDKFVRSSPRDSMRAVISEIAKRSPRGSIKLRNYEADSLERTRRSDPSTDYENSSSSHPSPSMSNSALPMDEEMTMRNAIFNKKTGNMTISKLNMDILQMEENDYELIVLKRPKSPRRSVQDNVCYNLPKFLQHKEDGYSLVSEVYVNNGYNFNSAPSTPSQSSCSTMEKPPKIRYETVDNKPGKLLIEVEDCADHYIPANESDDFEPDTLDRKPKKLRSVEITDFVDSLERPNQILLKSTGSFKVSSQSSPKQTNTRSNFNRNFGSLREIYEAKVRNNVRPFSGSFRLSSDSPTWKFPEDKSESGRILTLEERHSKRQRRSSPSVPPDVIPPPPHDSSPLYEQPKPPRKVIIDDNLGFSAKPPLPPKNVHGRSTGQKLSRNSSKFSSTGTSGEKTVSRQNSFDVEYNNCLNRYIMDVSPPKSPTETQKVWNKFDPPTKQEDSGYLSTDSNEGKAIKLSVKGFGSETDESVGDAHSESGAESIETHSVFFGTYRKGSSVDDAVDDDVMVRPTNIIVSDEGSSTDSETAAYSTVLPYSTRNSFRIRK